MSGIGKEMRRNGLNRHQRILRLVVLVITLLATMTAALALAFPTGRRYEAKAADENDVVVTKYWDDEGYADRFRPSSVTLHLAVETAPDVEVASLTLTEADAIADDAWQGIFEGVDKFDAATGELIPYVVTEDVPENYIASYDNGYSGYELTFADDAALAYYRNVELVLYHGDEAITWGDLSEYLPYSLHGRGESIQIPGVSGSYQIYPVDGSLTVNEGGIRPSTGPYWKQFMMENASSILSQRYVIDLVGDSYPESIPGFQQLTGYIWRYRYNIGRNIPSLEMVLHNESWGTNGPPLPLLLAFSEIKPVRSPNKNLEVTDTINLKSMPCKKVWDDVGHESHRPQSVTLDVYQDDASEPFKTVTVHPSDATDDHTWESAFTDLPRYRSDYSEHEYTIVEHPVPGYSEPTYDSEYYNGVDLTFSTDTNVGYGTNYQMFDGEFHQRGMYPYILGYSENVNGQYQQHMSTTLAGDTISYAGKEGFFLLEWAPHPMPEQGVFTVSSIRRVHIENIEKSKVSYGNPSQTWRNLQAGLRGLGNYNVHEIVPGVAYNFESAERFSLWTHYKWDDTQPFAGADIITNHTNWKDVSFTKVWDDKSDSSDRPESCTFDLYDDGMHLVKTVTLTADDADASDPYVWHGSLGEYLTRNDDGTERPYTIRERPVEGYYAMYDSDYEGKEAMRLTLRIHGSESVNASADTRQDQVSIYAGYVDMDGTHQGIAVSDDLYVITVPASRITAYVSKPSDWEIVSVERVPTDREYAKEVSGSDSNRCEQTIQYMRNGSSYYGGYQRMFADEAGDSWTRGDEDPDAYAYLLYEQRSPFPYDNIIRNRPLPKVTVMKGNTSNGAIADAKMEFVHLDTAQAVHSWTTTTSPEMFRMSAGHYAIRETEAPSIYAIASDVPVEIDEYGVITSPAQTGAQPDAMQIFQTGRPIIMYDQPTKVVIRKEYAAEHEGVSLLQLIDEDGAVMLTTGAEETPLTGMLQTRHTYTLHETMTPDGFSLAEDVQFTVADDATPDNPQVVTVTNRPIRAEISKVDMTGSNEVIGASLTLSEKNGNVIDEWVSEASPHVIGNDKLELGKTYVLHEVSAPDGYIVAADVEFVAGTHGSPDVVKMVDKATTVSVSKVEVTGGPELPGARLSVIDSGGNIVDEWTSGNTPHLIVATLLPGNTYVLHEVSAPDDHEMASDIEFTVSTDGSIDKVEMVDEVTESDEEDDQMERQSENPDEDRHDGGDKNPTAPSGDAATDTSSRHPQQAGTPMGSLLQTGAGNVLGLLVVTATLAGIAYVVMDALRR